MQTFLPTVPRSLRALRGVVPRARPQAVRVQPQPHTPSRVVHAHASSSNVGVQGWQERSAGTSTSTSTSGRTTVVDDFATDARPIILYDGVCGLCNGAVNLMLDIDTDARFRLAALQSPAGRRLLQRCGRSPDDISSIVVVESGNRFHLKSEAILRIANGLSNPYPLLAFLGFPVPHFIRDPLYDLVANNRYNILGKRDECRLRDDSFADRFIVE